MSVDQDSDRLEGSSLVERAIDRLTQPADTQGLSTRRDNESEESVGPPHSPAKRHSRQVSVDLEKLRTVGGFSPSGIFTRTTEEFRMIKHAILMNEAKRRKDGSLNSNLVMVTSSREGEGKTFVAINLAMSLAAERDKQVLLIDADLSDPSIPERLGIRAERGLIDFLDDVSIDLTEVLLRTNVEGLSVLPAGHPHPLSTELVASARMEQFMSEIARRYADRIIVLDTPPVLATSEPAALAMHVGQIAFVVEASRTSQAAIKEALGLISICPDIGFVLNKAPFQFGEARFGSYYKTYAKSYYRGKKKIMK